MTTVCYDDMRKNNIYSACFCYLCFVFVMLSCLFVAALWSPAGKGLPSWLSCV